MCDLALGSPIYRIDQDLVDLGMEGYDACARDQNGNFIIRSRQPVDDRILISLLELLHPERWGRPQTKKFPSFGVLVIGDRPTSAKTDCTASIKARQWKSASRMVWGEEEA